MKEQVCIAMSGGVDSSVAAVLLGQVGYALSASPPAAVLCRGETL